MKDQSTNIVFEIEELLRTHSPEQLLAEIKEASQGTYEHCGDRILDRIEFSPTVTEQVGPFVLHASWLATSFSGRKYSLFSVDNIETVRTFSIGSTGTNVVTESNTALAA